MIDQPTTVRAGEELDLPRLANYLIQHLTDASGPLVVEQFPSGYSNLTYLLRLGEQELVLRRPPFGANIKSAHDMGREYKVLTGLRRVYNKVPRPLLYCEDEAVIGAPFYVMERVRGMVLRAQPPQGVALTPPIMTRLSEQAIDTLAELHGLDVVAAGLADLGRPQGYTERQISGWTRRYRAAQTDAVPTLEQIMPWLEQNLPGDSGAALIHNDYKYDNLILDPADLTKVIAVLDWEMCTLGDPLMDLGTTLGYWIEANDPPALIGMFGLTALPGNLTRQQVLERYMAASGRAVKQPLFYYVYGLFKIAVIIQQIYARYRQGHTKDERFAKLDQVVRDCGQLAVLALAKDRISGLM
ncbi:MAG: phosphotransferase family protein [Caldilinea sp. CFX5]|nr:phosphotransferase family protein [Caldilinea sp. CFX5]